MLSLLSLIHVITFILLIFCFCYMAELGDWTLWMLGFTCGCWALHVDYYWTWTGLDFHITDFDTSKLHKSVEI
ncbi:hypothetical protein Hanom_Chr11g01055341 [Helianthus anomalus]